MKFRIGVAMVCLAAALASSTHAVESQKGEPGYKTDIVLKFTIPEHDLYPENIAYDSVSGDFFLGSLSQSRIIRIRADGSYDDFVLSPEASLLSSVGMKVDASRRVLWVCSGRYTLFANYASAPAVTGVLTFNIEDGSLIHEWMLDQESDYHIFNDLALAANGDAYATTTLIERVYRLPANSDEMELVLQLDPGSHNNGIALDHQERFLFMTIDRSLYRLELATDNLVEIGVPEDEALGTDGLYVFNNSLVTVKPRFKKISQLFMDKSFTVLTRVDVLAQDHEQFAYPTTGVIVGDKLVFVATSYADVPRNTESTEQHPDVLIYEVELRGE